MDQVYKTVMEKKKEINETTIPQQVQIPEEL